MPALYAHYRFGVEVLEKIPADLKKKIQRFRRLYDVGLHGPDLFFNYSPGIHTKIGDLGSYYHAQTGVEFFTRVCHTLRLDPSEGAESYLYGVLAHYCLDTICHPLIDGKAEAGEIVHTELESEFDRYLMEKDGKINPAAFDGTRHLKLTKGECETAAGFYPPANGHHIKVSLDRMRMFTKLLNQPEGVRQNVVGSVTSRLGPTVSGLLMPMHENTRCSYLDAQLFTLYQQAVDTYPVMLEQIQAFLTANTPLGEEFSLDFG